LTLILIKICVTITIVLGLSIVAERVSPKWAGLLGGYPLGIAIVLIFISFEEGPAFAAQSAIHSLAGLSANLSVFAAYGLVLSLRPNSSFIWPALASLTAFFSIAIPIGYVDFTLTSSVTFILFIIIGCIYAFKHFPDMKIEKAVKLGFGVTFTRATMACFVVLSITGLAEQMGPELAGSLGSFPSTVFPLIIIMHFTYGPAPVLTIIKHFPNGLGAMVVFGIIYVLYLEDFGLIWGTAFSFFIATLYLLAYSAIQQKMRQRG